MSIVIADTSAVSHRRLRFHTFLLAAVIAVISCTTPSAHAGDSAVGDRDVRLVVVIVVDQLRGDLVTRFQNYFESGGFRRLEREGALFANAHYTYGSTETAPGHATISTGRIPRQHGIIANKWYLDPEAADGTMAISDSACRPVPAAADSRAVGSSARALIGPNFADQFKLNDRRSRVFSMALKDRAAILLAGHIPNGVFWWSLATGRFVSSTAYCDRLPDYLDTFNATKPPEQFAGKTWDPLLPAESYAGCFQDQTDWHDYLGLGATFPHHLPAVKSANPREFYRAFWCTPYGNEMLIDLAERVVTSEKLGAGPAPDMLCLGLSSNDVVGHFFGPDTPEVMDMTIRTDRQLARLLDMLDRNVGLAHCLIALTGDHGTTSTPLLTRKIGLGGGVLDLPAVQHRLNDQLQGFFPIPAHGQPPHTIVLGLDMPWVYLNRQLMATLPADRQKEALTKAVEVLKSYEGVADVFTAEELSGECPSQDDLSRWLAWRCYYPGRSGELYVKLSPFWYKTDDKISGHDNGSNHDRHVPIYLYGPRVKPGRFFVPADPCDIAVTLSSILGIEPPVDASGRVLFEALDTRPQ